VHIKQSCGYLFVLLLFTGSLALGNRVWGKFSLPFQQGNQSVTMPVVHVGAVACPCPLDMNGGAHLLIPAIGVDAPVEPVGVLPNGDLNVPQKNQWTAVGWYKDGTIPGQSGSAIIDGHLDRPGGAPAVFWDLRQLRRGDIVMIMDARGQTLHFQVVQLQTYQPDVAPLAMIYGDTSGVYLNLITCAGRWMPSRHQTTERLVVFTRLLS
jgi:LPXTG-site transpeptidase (sortase) family protein